MKIPHSMSNEAILDVLNRNYDLMANQLTFIPWGQVVRIQGCLREWSRILSKAVG